MQSDKIPFLKIRDVYKQFGHVQALRGVSVQAKHMKARFLRLWETMVQESLP